MFSGRRAPNGAAGTFTAEEAERYGLTVQSGWQLGFAASHSEDEDLLQEVAAESWLAKQLMVKVG